MKDPILYYPVNSNQRLMNKIFIWMLIFCFILTTDRCTLITHADELKLSAPGVRVALSPPVNPAILKGIKVHPDNPFRFDFIMDQGDVGAQHAVPLHDEANRLIKYFLASLTVPEKDLWVNLSPYEKDRIVPESFGLTEMGRDLLAEDYILKQITASLIYPEDEVGKKFWKRIYEEAQSKYNTTNIPVNTFNKVWIVPEKAVVYENAEAGTAYVVESKLKVMLEADYLAEAKNGVGAGSPSPNKGEETSPVRSKDVNQIGSQIIREIVIPELTREVNENQNFAQLRQVYNSLILATWYKKKIKDSILSQVYADKNKIAGVEYSSSVILSEAKDLNQRTDPSSLKSTPQDDTELIYQRYLQAFKKGVYNYIKEEPDPVTQQPVPRKYFSGGFDLAMAVHLQTTNQLPKVDAKSSVIISAKFDQAMVNHQVPEQYWTNLRINLDKLKRIFNDPNLRQNLIDLIIQVRSLASEYGLEIETDRLKALQSNGNFKDGFVDEAGRLIRDNGPTIKQMRQDGKTLIQKNGKELEAALVAKLDEEYTEALELGAKASNPAEIKRHLVNLLETAITIKDRIDNTIYPKTTAFDRNVDAYGLITDPRLSQRLGIDWKNTRQVRVLSIGAGLLPFDAIGLNNALHQAQWNINLTTTELPSAYSNKHIVISDAKLVQKIKGIAERTLADKEFVSLDNLKEIRLVVSSQGKPENANIIEIYAGFTNPLTQTLSYRHVGLAPQVRFLRQGKDTAGNEVHRNSEFFTEIVHNLLGVDGLRQILEQTNQDDPKTFAFDEMQRRFVVSDDSSSPKITVQPKPVENDLKTIGVSLIVTDDLSREAPIQNSMNLVTAFQVVEHILPQDLPKFLEMVNGLLVEGGVFVTKNPLKGMQFSDKDKKSEINFFQKQGGKLVYVGSMISNQSNTVIENPDTFNQFSKQFYPNPLISTNNLKYLFSSSDAAMLNDLMGQVGTKLPLTFSVDSTELVTLNNWPTIDQLNEKMSDETKQLIILAAVKNKNFSKEVNAQAGILQAIAYFRSLHPDKKQQVRGDLKTLGYDSTAQWFEKNNDGFLADLYEGIKQQFGVEISEQTKRFITVHDQSVRRARGLRLAMNTVSSLQETETKKKALYLLANNKRLREVIYDARKAAVILINDEEAGIVREALWGLKQVEGININLVRLSANRYYAYDEYALKKKAQEYDLSIGVTTQGLEHLIRLDMARGSGIFFDVSNQSKEQFDEDVSNINQSILTQQADQPLAVFDTKEAFWRAAPLSGQILELERTPIQTVYIATMDREVALRTQLEAEAESNRIFNRQSQLVIVDDSTQEILKANQKTLQEMYKRFGWQSWHITPQLREKEYDQYTDAILTRYQEALDLNQLRPQIQNILETKRIISDGKIDRVALRKYLEKNVFNHISGVRNRTLLKAKGESTIMSMDDDAPPETYVVAKSQREQIRKDRLEVREQQIHQLLQEAGDLLGETIDTEEQLYRVLANLNGNMNSRVEVLIQRYFGYNPVNRAGRIPLAMGEIQKRDQQMLDTNGWGAYLGISHQRYHGLMTPSAPYMLTMSDFVYSKPRTEKKQGAFEVLPVNVHRMGDLVGKKAGETDLPLMGSPLDGKGDLRGTMAQPVEAKQRDALGQRTITYVAAPFVEDQDTSAVAQFIRYLQIEHKKAANLQHANQSALLVGGVGGFVADTYVIFNRAALSNQTVSPSIGRDLRLEEPPYIAWVKSPMLKNSVTVAYSPVAGGQQREIAERLYDISRQDYTEVVGVVARASYEQAVRRFYQELANRLDLQQEDKHYERLRLLGQMYIQEAELFKTTPEQQESLDYQRNARAMMLGELSSQKANLEKQLVIDPTNLQLAQVIRDIDLIFVQYAESFTFYHAKKSSDTDFGPKTDSSDFFYRIKRQGNRLFWERVIPYLEVVPERGVKVARKTQWLKHGTNESGQIMIDSLIAKENFEIEGGRAIVLSEIPKEGEELIVPVLFNQMREEFISNVEKKARDQIISDGELMLFWPDLVDVAIPWREEAKDLVRKQAEDDKIIARIRALSEQKQAAGPDEKTILGSSFYQLPNRRVQKGKFSLQFNPDREKRRPSQYQGGGIQQPFNPDGFNFNKISSEEIISEGVLQGMQVSTIVNARPFAEGHFLLVPQRQANHPQYLDKPEYIQMVLERMANADKDNLKITYNSIAAFASLNHLHFQGFYYGGDLEGQPLFNNGQLPVEKTPREKISILNDVQISKVLDYPAHALAFTAKDRVKLAQAVFQYVDILNQRKIAYNILFNKTEVIVFPRQYQKVNSLGTGTAVLELSGEFIVNDQETLNQTTEDVIKQNLQEATIAEDLFKETVTALVDKAMLSNTGGIDLTPAKLNLQTNSNGVISAKGGPASDWKFNLDPAMLKQLQNSPGFVPVIINIQPLRDLKSFLDVV